MKTPISPDEIDVLVQTSKAEAVTLADGVDPSYQVTAGQLIDLLGGIAINLALIAEQTALPHIGGTAKS